VADPVVRAPTALRPFLRFRRLTPKALGAARGVLDVDAGFRERVTAAVSEDQVGTPAWRWLTRPDGWEADWQRTAEEVDSAEAAAKEASDIRRLERELEGLREAVRRSDERARQADAAASRAAEAMEQDRAARASAEAELDDARSDVERLRAERAAAVRSLKDLEKTHMAARAELRREIERRRAAESTAAGGAPDADQGSPAGGTPAAREGSGRPSTGGGGGAGASGQAVGAGGQGRGAATDGSARAGASGQAVGGGAGDRAEGSGASTAGGTGGGPGPSAVGGSTASGGDAAGRTGLSGSSAAGTGPSFAQIADGVRRAAEAARELAGALAETAAALGDAGGDPDRWAGRVPPEVPVDRPAVSGRQGGGRPPRRRPAPVPPPLLDESPAAAAHLLRLPGAYVLVDGYNVSMTAWGSVPVAEQRDRLVDLLDELHARIGVTPVVVFDGVAAGGAAAPVGRSVRVRFTDEGVEADDVVIAMVDEVPIDRPVVVVSSDGRVREGAQRRGANVVGAAQFLAAAGRS